MLPTVPRGGSVGVGCFAYTDEFDRDLCEQLLSDLKLSGLPTHSAPPMKVLVGGIALDLAGNCWSARPREICCFGKGGMEWAHGDRAALTALRDQVSQSPRGPRTHLEDGRALRLDVRTVPCGPAARGGHCTYSAFFGVADKPAAIRHFALIPDGNTRTLVICTSTLDLDTPPPCRQFFELPKTITASLFRLRHVRRRRRDRERPAKK